MTRLSCAGLDANGDRDRVYHSSYMKVSRRVNVEESEIDLLVKLCLNTRIEPSADESRTCACAVVSDEQATWILRCFLVIKMHSYVKSPHIEARHNTGNGARHMQDRSASLKYFIREVKEEKDVGRI